MFNKKILFFSLLFLFIGLGFMPAILLSSGDGTVLDLVTRFEAYAEKTTNQLMLLVGIGLATLVSEDLASIAAGLLAAESIITPAGAIIASGLGIYIGDMLLYLAGYIIGISALQRAPLKWFLTQRTVQQCKNLYEKRGIAIIVSSRFLPGTRTATFFAAGLVKMNPVKLLVIFGLTVTIWTPILVLTAMTAGEIVTHYADLYSRYAIWVFLGTLALIFFVYRVIVPLFTWKGRRLLLCKWRRFRHWEFWPIYVVNSVTFLYVLYLGFIRYRLPTLFTVTNPGIKPDSGFLGESKSAILKSLPQQFLGRWKLIEGNLSQADKMEQLVAFIGENNLTYPVVLKPDLGQRGKNVSICHTVEDARRWLSRNQENFILMEFLPGEEFGVFYYRLPSDEKGQIFSVTRKKLIQLIGDGIHTLEELILMHDRALCMAPYFFREHQAELLNIVPEGATVDLAPIGTHSRGSIFLDGNSLITPELTEAIESILRPYEDFYFGRFDLKVVDDDDLMAGKGIKIIELNGLTSEATHIYDPSHSILYGWKTLLKQWSIAFQIADLNHRNGNTPMALTAFLLHLNRGGR